jgi:hypothetical protein
MKKFNKLNKRDWKVKVPYQPTEEEQEILNSNPDTEEGMELKKQTIKDINSKIIDEPTPSDLDWLNALETRLKYGIDLTSYKLCAIEVMMDETSNVGIEYSGIFNYYIGRNLIQKRF